MRTAAVLPVKRFSHAKQRLGASVADPLRAELVPAMVQDVLEALAATEAIERTILVTREPAAIAAASHHRRVTTAQDSEQGQSAAVSVGIERALESGIERVLCIPGDCPALDPAELTELLASQPDFESEVVIVPDRHGSGTNGLLLRPPGAIVPSFGPGSCERHIDLARQAGARCRLEHPSSLLLDVDTGADLAALRQRFSELDGRARRTRAVLQATGERAWAASHSAA